jgi:hypothetical protein
MLRQGDVLLVPIELGRKRGRLVSRGRVVLAEGEATWHAHVVLVVVRAEQVESRA